MEIGSSNLLWYNRPARHWMTEALPIGNGRLGAMVFGSAPTERLQFNEISLWTGDEEDAGEYQNFGDIFVDLGHSDLSEYQRSLDIGDAVHRVGYTGGGAHYYREAFVSAENQALVVHFSASDGGRHNGTIRLTGAHGEQTTADEDCLSFAASLINGLAYEARLLVRHLGGTVAAHEDTLVFSGVETLTLYLNCGTNFLPERSKSWRGSHPHDRIIKQLNAAVSYSYTELFSRHRAEHRRLFDRFTLELGEPALAISDLPTDERLANYRDGAEDVGIERLFALYGRYLLISSSRPGSLPANLQGLWNEDNHPIWRCDYHSNINVQMNYWPAEPGNLAECHIPFLEYINSLREVRREATYREYSARGWTVQTENGIFGGSDFKWNTPGSAWYTLHLWEHFSFGRDIGYLRDFAYPIMREICEFWLDRLKSLPDGTLVAPLGWSPEHGPVEDGCAFDQQIIWDLLTNTLEALRYLGADNEFRDTLFATRDRLLGPKIGKWGQLMEWMEDKDDPKDHHRHISQLFALHPGRQISPRTTPELAKAARVTLDARGDESTGWSKAWKINFWARLHDGDRAHSLLRQQLRLIDATDTNYDEGGGTYSNLLDAHPPFQIDGNFGALAGVIEMLLQSHNGYVDLLPALPTAWPSGWIAGVRARGGFELDISWKEGRLYSVVVRSNAGETCRLRSPVYLTGNGIAGEDLEFATERGAEYVFFAPVNAVE